jgi:PAS domain S-box-containing protein
MANDMNARERRGRERRQRLGRRKVDLLAERTPRVLLVEPHEDTRLLYTTLLEDSGYAVYGVETGADAVSALQQRLPDIVIMEMALPVVDGFSVLQALRAAPPTADIPAVVVTAFLHFNVPERAKEAGATVVLTKPATLDSVLSAVDELILATPPERFARRQLRRSLQTIRQLATQLPWDVTAQERVRSLIDRLQVAVLVMDDQGRYVAASTGAETLTGYTRAELLRMSAFDTALGPDLPMARSWEDKASADEGLATAVIRHKAGRPVRVHASFATVLPGLHAAALGVDASNR